MKNSIGAASDIESEGDNHVDLEMSAELVKPTSSRRFFTKRNTKRDRNYEAPKVPNKKDNRFQCYPCHIRFSNKNALDQHNQIHLVSVEDRTCKYCTTSPFTQLSSLNRHVKVQHPAEYNLLQIKN